MNSLHVITATYNHEDILSNLYRSLCNQTFKRFMWTVINDGSKDKTAEVIRGFVEEGKLEIDYIEKSNGGKSSALNFAFDKVMRDEFALIIDDDEQLFPDALEKVYNCCCEMRGHPDVGMILFTRVDKKTGKVIENRMVEESGPVDFFTWHKKYNSDGYIGYMGYALQDTRFPIFDGERYVGPSVLAMLVSRKYKLLATTIALGETEYLAGGITKQGRRLRLKNPCGSIYYCMLLQDPRAALKTRLKYSLLGYTYFYYAHLDKIDLRYKGIEMKRFIPLMKLPAFFLAKCWKRNEKNWSEPKNGLRKSI